jgi:predicted nucleic acid-binding protein
MSNPTTDYVIDASVAIKLFLAEPLSDKAVSLFARLTLDPPPMFHVPELFYIECANILWKSIKRMGLPENQAVLALARLKALPLRAITMSSLAEEALILATAHNITAYDASYVALGERLGLITLTADEKLVLALSGTTYKVQWLGNL